MKRRIRAIIIGLVIGLFLSSLALAIGYFIHGKEIDNGIIVRTELEFSAIWQMLFIVFNLATIIFAGAFQERAIRRKHKLNKVEKIPPELMVSKSYFYLASFVSLLTCIIFLIVFSL